jgi:hypothetical protein
MRRWGIQILMQFSLAVLFLNAARSQHFAFFEAESQQPFFIKYNGGIVSSTPSGFLMLSGIMESAIEIVIGFPGAGSPQTQYTVVGLDRDRGFYLKKMERGEWVLMDRNDMSLLRGISVETSTVSKPVSAPASAAVKQENVPSSKTEAKKEQSAVQSKTTQPNSASVKSVPKTNANNESKAVPPSPQSSLIRELLPLISYLNVAEDNSYLSRIYIERPRKGKADTVIVEIDKRAAHPIRNRPNN